jgi:predicted alpha/beta-hydrolase family hydrolase
MDTRKRIVEVLVSGPESASDAILLAHGAGAPMDSPFMNTIAEGLAIHGIKTIRFEFPYMQKARETGRRRPPNAGAVLQSHWVKVIEETGEANKLVIGGKSMGGRIASQIADQAEVKGLICLGYPFHAPGKADNRRTEHLKQLRTRALILQGSRDPFGKRDEVVDYELSPRISVKYVEDGDHSFKPRKKSGRTLEQNMDYAVEEIVRFMNSLQ